MTDKRVVERWIDKAEKDFGLAVKNMPDEDYSALVCFHFHQAAEKLLKTYIVKNALDFRSVHDLIELLEICKTKDLSFQELRNSCVFLNPFYIETRYPVEWEDVYTADEVKMAHKHSEEVRDFVKARL